MTHTRKSTPPPAVDGAGLSRLFKPSGEEADRKPEDIEAAEVVGRYVFALDPGVARIVGRRRDKRG